MSSEQVRQPPELDGWVKTYAMQRPRYVRHSEGLGIKELRFSFPGHERFMSSIRLLELTLQSCEVIPFHFNEKRDAFYFPLRGGASILTVNRGGFIIGEALRGERSDMVVMPARRWHALMNQSEEPATIQIIISHPKPDIVWSEEADRLFSGQ